MEEISKKKNNKGLVVSLIIIIVLLLGALGFGGYKYMSLQNGNDKLSNENKSATNDYNLFVKKMKAERARLASLKNSEAFFDETEEGYELAPDEYSTCYHIYLDKEGTLSFSLCIESEKQEIAKKVLFYRVVSSGNGGYKSLFYVTEEGYAYSVDMQKPVTTAFSNKDVVINAIKQNLAKEIVNIIPGGTVDVQRDDSGKVVQSGGGAAHPFFIDINGNIYPCEFDE